MNCPADPGHTSRWHRLYCIFDWVMQIAVLQALWLLGTLAGGVLLGFGPASTAVSCAWMYRLGAADASHRKRSTWSQYWHNWHDRFWPSQVTVAVPALSLWPILFWALTLPSAPVAMALCLVGVLVSLTVGYLAIATAITQGGPPISVLRIGISLAWLRPLRTLGVGAACLILMIAATLFAPASLMVLVPSVPLLVTAWDSLRRLDKGTHNQPNGRPNPL